MCGETWVGFIINSREPQIFKTYKKTSGKQTPVRDGSVGKGTKLDDLTLITRTHGGWKEQTSKSSSEYEKEWEEMLFVSPRLYIENCFM